MHIERMYGSAANSSSSVSRYFWSECDSYYGDGSGPSTGFLILLTTYCFEFLVGAPPNLWLICHILRKRSKVDGVLPADFFPLHLSVTQLLSYVGSLLFLANHFLWQSLYVFSITTFLTGMVIFIKPLLLCLVCMERYMAVVRPVDYLRFKAHKYRWGCMAVSWCIFLSFASASLVERTPALVCSLYLPVLVIHTVCCVSILRALRKPPPGDGEMMKKKKGQVVTMKEGGHEQSRGTENRKEEKVEKTERSESRVRLQMNSMKKKAFITIVVIQAVLTLNYLPFITTVFIGRLLPARTLKCQYVAMSVAAAASCSYLQPLLYLHRLGRLPCMTP